MATVKVGESPYTVKVGEPGYTVKIKDGTKIKVLLCKQGPAGPEGPEGPAGAGTVLTLINGQTIGVYNDPARPGKTLSIGEQTWTYTRNLVCANDWLNPGNANHAEAGHIMLLDGTVVGVTAHCEDTAADTRDLHLWVDNTDFGAIGTLAGGVNASFVNTGLNIDFFQGAKVRVRAQGGLTGAIKDTTVTIITRWRGT